ncbi:hypothetical protein AOQ84DRAFT_358290 [Glonium stellatum]|uniref:Uncharacterized protein n=1 Tax=Glonium stellatum TaxID=574774 RepID=A0A8E2FDN5_9PEZI|nr:hypothetical protein AOQ84DRAFT_358290 [Glonium stellatum]
MKEKTLRHLESVPEAVNAKIRYLLSKPTAAHCLISSSYGLSKTPPAGMKKKPALGPKARNVKPPNAKAAKVAKKVKFPPVKLHRNRLLNLNAPPTDQRMVIAERNRHSSPLLRLPLELRNKIFLLVLGGCYIWLLKRGHITRPRKLWQCTTEELENTSEGRLILISSTCRQFYDDTCLMPFRNNVFLFDNISVQGAFVKKLLPVQKRAIELAQSDTFDFVLKPILKLHGHTRIYMRRGTFLVGMLPEAHLRRYLRVGRFVP